MSRGPSLDVEKGPVVCVPGGKGLLLAPKDGKGLSLESASAALLDGSVDDPSS
jgi:hypothetical protein